VKDKVVLAYSGVVDTSVAIKWLQEKYNVDVIAVTIDVGNEKDFSAVRQKALKVGAIKALVIDGKELFVKYFVFPALQANALYEGQYPLATALSRPLMVKLLVDAAVAEGAAAIAHGCTGKGNDQVRFELAYKALAPQLVVIAPWRLWSIRSREEAIDYAQNHGINLGSISKKNIYSRDMNAWHMSHEGGDLEDPWNRPQESLFQLTKPCESGRSIPSCAPSPDTRTFRATTFSAHSSEQSSVDGNS